MEGERFGLSKYQLIELMSERRLDAVAMVKEFGGVEGIAKHLETDLKAGISCSLEELEQRRDAFGANVIPPNPPKSFLALCVDAIQDKTLLILIGAAILSIGLGVGVEEQKDIAWVEGAAILAAVVLVVFVTALNDWTKERQFRGLQKKLDTDSRFSVIRNNEIIELALADIVVGDVARFQYGNTFPVDGVLIQGFDVTVNEATLTGETLSVKKKLETDPHLLAGTQVMEGGGTMLVTAVGPYSQQGIIFQLMTNREDEAGFIVKGLRRLKNRLFGRCQKKPVEEDLPLSKIKPVGVAIDEVETRENAISSESPVEEEEEEEEEEELKGLAKLNLVKRMKRRKQRKERQVQHSSESGSTESGSILQRKLDKLAVRIGYAGTLAAILCIIILCLKFAIEDFAIAGRPWNSSTDFSELLHFVIIGITVLVVAVPEGLPLAVTIALAYSVKKMLKDNNLVRHLHACETMGNATAICSDKTGTLTTNRMTVVESFMAGNHLKSMPQPEELPQNLLDILKVNISVNSSYTSKLLSEASKPKETAEKTLLGKLRGCFSRQDPEELLGEGLAKQVGNVTECALLGFLVELGIDYEKIRLDYPVEVFTKVFTFNSSRKSMSTVIPLPGGGHRVLTKGASEIVLEKCSFIVKGEDSVVSLSSTDRKEIASTVVQSMACNALRTIALAYRDIPPEVEPDWDSDTIEEDIITDLVLLTIVGIQDPVRPEVPGCIRTCQDSGIVVRMVTGDNVETARAIALKCGIISRGDNYLVLEGKEFIKKVTVDSKINQERMDNIWPRLRVLARSSPKDKHTLVEGIINSRLHKSREVVAVTGDGTNDGPALKRADVGFAMGIAGTDVAKEASDIILTDDNFASIVKAVSWGRNVYDSISKFLQFQLTVNLVAVTLTLISAVTIGDSPLRALQLLWVNLIMDTLASLALATEQPTPELLERKPYGRNKSLFSRQMWLFMLGHSAYQLTVLFVLLFAGAELLNIDDGRNRDLRATPGHHFTVIFNTFVCMQLFNEINARKIHGEWNIFKGMQLNYVFLFVVVGQVSVQILIVQFGGIVFVTRGLTLDLWLWCIFLGSTELLIGQILTLIPVKSLPWKQTAEDQDEPDSDPIQDDATRARYLWMKSLSRLRTQIRVVNAFRQGVETGSVAALVQGTPRPARYSRPVTGIETAV